MAFIPKKQAFNASIHEVALGTGERRIVVGGENVLPFYTFDAPIAHRPIIAVEISDTALEGETVPGILSFYEGCASAADMARRAERMEGASAICLRFGSADPNGANRSVAECVEIAKAVADAVTLPLLVMGCKNVEKDTALLKAVAEALRDKNILLLSAREENYQAVGASANLTDGPRLGAESSVDINLAKQLNILLTRSGVPAADICMDLGASAVGYGFEYLSSTLDRVRLAALSQNDDMLQMPIVTSVCGEAWDTQEAILPESEAPEWGSAEERGIEMEICTASACLVSGSNIVVMRHPAAVATAAKFIDSLM